MSNNGTIIHLDNDEEQLKEFKSLYDQHEIDLELISCQTKDEFQKLVEDNYNNLRGLVFDLFGAGADKGDLSKEDAEFLESINDSFEHISIPIFIYSGFLPRIEEEFNEHGTIFKVDKGDGPDEILRLLKLFHNSGFLDVFSPGGKIEKELHKDLNKAFVTQFSNNSQIEEIIKVVDEESEEKNKERIERIFKRIAVRSLMTSLNFVADEEIEFLNPVEHYLQRISPFKIWTGDVFKHEDGEKFLVITPRCDVMRADEILICEIKDEDFPANKKGVQRALRDNPILSGYDRILPPTPFFEGGKVKLSSYKIVYRAYISDECKRIISLSDELTNEILGKFGSYFFRSGITPWHEKETLNHLKEIS
jgi:hypothetical protein